MCGILGVVINNPNHIKRDVYNVYRNQSYRGKDGFGIALKHLEGEIKRDRTMYEHEIFSSPLWNEIEKDDLFLLHHRIPTSTPNVPNSNHPLTDPTKTLYLIHNGIINGYEELASSRTFESEIKNEEKCLQWKQHYSRFTDSELCVHRLCDLISESKNDILDSIKVLGEENFFSAFLIFHANEHKIYFASNGADLNYYKFRGNKFISSLPYNKKFKEIDYTFGYIDGEENVIKPLERSFYQSCIPGYWGNGDKGFYDDFALEESYFFDTEKEMLDSQLFAKFKEGHGCNENCAKCDYIEDCLDLFKEWRHQEYESDINS